MSDCIISAGAKSLKGYSQSTHAGKQVPTHRLIYCVVNKISIKSIKGLVVRHKCDNPGCINPDHLELGTHQDNMNDKVARNRQSHVGVRGQDRSKQLTDDDVLLIRTEYLLCEYKVLAARYGVTVQTICDIVKRRSWKHI